MTDKEFKKLNRSELIDIIYQLQKNEKLLSEENEMLRNQLKSKQLKISNAGSIAEAVLVLNDIFSTAQKAADEYLEQLHLSNEELEGRSFQIIDNAKKQAADILSEAQKQSIDIIAEANNRAEAKWNEVNRNIDILLSSSSSKMSPLA